jgi:hypothetical protein
MTAQPLASYKHDLKTLKERIDRWPPLPALTVGCSDQGGGNSAGRAFHARDATGVTVAVELELGRDPGAGGIGPRTYRKKLNTNADGNWEFLCRRTTKPENTGVGGPTPHFHSWHVPSKNGLDGCSVWPTRQSRGRSNSAKGSVSHEKMSVHILKLVARHEDAVGTIPSGASLPREPGR